MDRETKLERYGEGVWVDEPDRVEWRSEGLPCLIVRSNLGTLCGYVGVPKGHPWYGRHYDDIGADVHGGLTYGSRCQGHICHVPQPGESDDVYWVGFDCGHVGDLMPQIAYMQRTPREGDEYRDIRYVSAEVERLAAQAREAV